MSARSYLYVPGNRPDRFDKALASGADAIILDLEDAVPHSAKDEARDAVAAWLQTEPVGEIWVRINSGDLLEADAKAMIDAGIRRLSIPKASVVDIERVEDVEVIALIETAAGVLDAREIAALPGVVRLAIGEVDLSAELNVTDEHALMPMRGLVILASAAAGLEPPIGPVSRDFKDMDELRESTLSLKSRGFGARAAIHPAQVPIINEAFMPSAEEIATARRLLDALEAAGGGVCLDENGRMVDEAVVRAARRTLSLKRD